MGVLAAALAVVLGLVVHALIVGVAPAPTSPRVASVMLALIPPGIEGVVFELGSGWGTLAFPLARRLPRPEEALLIRERLDQPLLAEFGFWMSPPVVFR